ITEVSPHRQGDQAEKHQAVPRRVDEGGVEEKFSAAGVLIVGSSNPVPEIGFIGPAKLIADQFPGGKVFPRRERKAAADKNGVALVAACLVGLVLSVLGVGDCRTIAFG